MNDTEKQKIREEWNETQFTNNIWANKDVVDVEQDNICDYWLSILDKTIKSKLEAVERAVIDENTSDGYHTFKELYEFRKVYNACLFNEWYDQRKYDVHKSEKHSDGEFCFGGDWFIVVATLPTGDISNHYEMKDWDLFKCEVREKAKEWDGHTSNDVLDRLLSVINKHK